MLITDKMVELVLSLLEVPRIKEAVQAICQNESGERKPGVPLRKTPASRECSNLHCGSVDTKEVEKRLQASLAEAQQINRQLQAENSQLQARLQEANARMSQMADNLTRAKSEIQTGRDQLQESQKANEKLDDQVKALRGEVQKWKKTLGAAMEAFKAFHALPEDEREESLGNIFRSDDLVSFIVSGSERKNFISIWEHARYEFNQGNLKYSQQLRCMLDFFMDIQHSAFGSHYAWQKLDEGDEYDEDICQKTPHSHASGIIHEVLLPGIEDEEGNLVKKAVVEVK